MSKLALYGGTPVLDKLPYELFRWPIVNDAMRQAQTDVLNAGNMSGTNISRQFEQEFARWNGRKYALAHNNGTNSLIAAMYGIGLGPGDELICPSITYWASCTGALALGAAVVFCDIREKDLQLDPASLEAHITPRTKAVMVVHYMAHPADMDPIMAIARKHGLKVIEDVSHAQGGHYKGKMLGTFGDAAGMSLMSGKSFAIGEGGMMLTDDPEIYRRAIRFGHYDRIREVYSKEETADTNLIPFGGQKFRMHQVSAAIGLEQLKKYESEIAEIDRAMKYFWQGIRDIEGLRMIYPDDPGSDKSGWYCSRMGYDAAAFSGVPNAVFAKALNAEVGGGSKFASGCNFPLHKSAVFHSTDIYGHGRPTAGLNLPPEVDLKALTGELPVAERINLKVIGEPWFKHCDKPLIDRYVEAVHKVAENHRELLAEKFDGDVFGSIALTKRKN
ncbi:MAG: DegT/DnrJ/EryC1/StrS family aminotransferase [Lentisphaeria bacterium]|nr:DegT/DnrJ/EryC1/StrS family aminotransferase [Lentisphaeria bacterium]